MTDTTYSRYRTTEKIQGGIPDIQGAAAASKSSTTKVRFLLRFFKSAFSSSRSLFIACKATLCASTAASSFCSFSSVSSSRKQNSSVRREDVFQNERTRGRIAEPASDFDELFNSQVSSFLLHPQSSQSFLEIGAHLSLHFLLLHL